MSIQPPPSRTAGPQAGIEDIPMLSRAPMGRECLVCYVYRMWRNHGCGDDLALVALYREYSAVHDPTLETRLGRSGVTNAAQLVFVAHQQNARYWNPRDEGANQELIDGVPPCREVVHGSTAACQLWLRSSTWRVSGAGRSRRLWA